jgi:hypothetical protein
MKRLFQVEGVFFDSKMKAKAAGKPLLGPDHRRYKEAKGNPRTHSHGMNDDTGNGFKKTAKERRK